MNVASEVIGFQQPLIEISGMYTGNSLISDIGVISHDKIFQKIKEKGLYFERGGKPYTLTIVDGSEMTASQADDLVEMISPIYTDNGRDVKEIVRKNYCGKEGSENIFVYDGTKNVGILQFYRHYIDGEKILHTKMFASDKSFRGGVLKFLKTIAIFSHEFDTAIISSGIPHVVDVLQEHYEYHTEILHDENVDLKRKAEKICHHIGIPIHDRMVVYSDKEDDIYSLSQIGKEGYVLGGKQRHFFISKTGSIINLKTRLHDDIVSFLEK